MPKRIPPNQLTVLEAMMPAGYLRPQDVIAMFDPKSGSYCYKLLRKMEKQGLIEQKSQRLQQDGHTRTTHYIALTETGLDMLLQTSSMPALQAARAQYDSGLKPCQPMTSREKARHLRTKEAERFLSGCGVLVSCDPRPMQQPSVYGSVCRGEAAAYSVAALYENGLIRFRQQYAVPEDACAFYQLAELPPRNVSDQQRHEISVISSTCLGAILSPARMMLVYRPVKNTGIGWNPKVEGAVKNKVFIAAMQLPHADAPSLKETACGLILLSGAREMLAVMRGEGLKTFQPNVFFSPFRSLYLLTNDALGRGQMRFILAYVDPAAELEQRLKKLKNADITSSSRYFPFCWKGRRCFAGLLFDAACGAWIAEMAQSPDAYAVLCFPQQQAFYRSLLPGVRQLVLKDWQPWLVVN